MDILKLYYKEEDLVVTPTRHQKDILQVAENMTVITSEEIETLNAHTLTDALNNIIGVKMEIKGGPASTPSVFIQGSELSHVLVMIDGVAMNNLSDNAVDVGTIPIQNIERIEIIKGPASSSWGSSLGGIIHIITKSAIDSEKITGTYSASYGEKNSTDYRAEASGKVGNAGYYFFAGNLNSDGLTEGTPYNTDNLYSKLSWNMKNRGKLLFTIGYNEGSRDNYAREYIVPNDSTYFISEQDDFKYLFSTFTLEHSIIDNAKFKLSFRSSSMEVDREKNTYDIKNKIRYPSVLIKSEESLYGGSMELTWKLGINNILFGLDYDRGKLKSESVIDGKQYLEKWAVFSNDTIMFDKLSLTPGLRYDQTNTNGDHLSPSFGLTYMITERNLFRGFIAKGFHIPPLSWMTYSSEAGVPNPDLKIEKVLSIQAGIESTALKYLWIKTTLFRHEISDGFAKEENMNVNKEQKQTLQGIELEIKTVSVYNTSLFSGFSFIDAKEKTSTGFFVPKYTFDIGINYHKKSFGAYLKGEYIYWDYSEDYQFNQDHIFIWDINLIKEIYWYKKINVKTFFTIHNIFNGSPYQSFDGLFEHPGRWIETGLKFNF